MGRIMDARSSLRDPHSLMGRTYILWVPGFVAGWSLGQKDDVGQEDAE